MIIKPLSDRELEAVYRLYMKKDFPRSELKSLRRLKDAKRRGLCEAYGLYGEPGLTAYAVFLKRPESDMRLLDYYAVCAERGKGYGTAFMKGIGKLFENETLIAEVESPDDGVFEEEIELRHRRKAFYSRNGWDPTELRTTMFGTRLDIMVLPKRGESVEDGRIEKELERLYLEIYPKEFRKGTICVGAIG